MFILACPNDFEKDHLGIAEMVRFLNFTNNGRPLYWIWEIKILEHWLGSELAKALSCQILLQSP